MGKPTAFGEFAERKFDLCGLRVLHEINSQNRMSFCKIIRKGGFRP